jgi:hypothetical protein
MDDVDRGLTLTSLGAEERREIHEIASATSTATTCTATTEGGIDQSMVIYVQQEQQELPASLITTAGSNSTEQQLITLVPQVCTIFLYLTNFQIPKCMMSLCFKI